MTDIKNNIKNLIIIAFVIVLSDISAHGIVLAFFSIPCAAVLVAYITYVCGISAGVMTTVASAVFNLIVFALMYGFDALGMCMALFSVVPGLFCGICLSKKLPARSTLFITAFSVAVFPILLLAYVKYSLKFNISDYFSDTFIQYVNNYLLLVKSIYPETADMLSGKESEIFSFVAIYLPGIIPCFVIMLCLIYAAFVCWLGKTACRRTMICNSDFVQGLDMFFLPKITALFLLVSMIFLFLDTDNITFMLFLNAIIVIFTLYAFEGFSFLVYKLRQKNYRFFLRVIIIVGIFAALAILSAFMPILNAFFVFAFVGMSDSANDFRRCGYNKGEFHEKQ